MSVDDSTRTVTTFKRGDLIEIEHTGTVRALGPISVRVLGVDVLGIIGVAAETSPLPPDHPDGPGDYLSLRDHPSVFPWAQVRCASLRLESAVYEKVWRNAEARWAAQA